MTDSEFLERLRRLDVRLTLDGDRIKVSAAPGALTAELRDELRARRDSLVEALRGATSSNAPAAVVGDAPASFQQESIWLFHELEPGSTTYNIPVVLALGGPLDVAALERALAGVVARHDVLRTTFVDREGAPYQHVHPPEPPRFRFDDFSAETRATRERLAEEIWKSEGDSPFDLAHDCPIRVALIRVEPEKHYLVVTFHHIAADGFSVIVFARDLFSMYQTLIGEEARKIPPMDFQYADYSRGQRSWAASPEFQKTLDFWTGLLGGGVPVLDLPADHPRPAVQTFRGATIQLTLSAEISTALRQLSRRNGSTLFMTMLAVFDTLLFRYAGEDDVIVGAPMLNRDRAEVQNLIGMFVNTIVLRSDLSGNPSFTDVLARVRQTCLGAFAHQDIPFARVLDELHPQRDSSRTPLFQVMFNMFPGDVAEVMRVGELMVKVPSMDRVLEAYNGQSKFDLTLYALDRVDGMRMVLAYNADLFDDRRMQQFLADLQSIVESVVRDPDVRIGDLMLAGQSARRLPRAVHPRRPGKFTELSPDFVDSSIVTRFAESVRRHSGRLAVSTNAHQWTYADLSANAARMAHLVHAAAQGEATRVGLLCEHGAPMVASILGTLTAGSAYVPLDPTFPEDRLAMLLDDANVGVLVADPKFAELAQRVAAHRCVVRTDAAPVPPTTTLQPPDPESTAYILYTSGSTGRPKGVLQNQRNVLHYVRGYTNAIELTAEDRMTLVASYTFDAAVVDIFSALLNGATLCPVSLRSSGLHGIARVIEDEKITVFHSTPTLFRALLGHMPSSAVANVRSVVLGGEKVQPGDIAAFRAAFAPGSVFVNLYGASEATIATMALVPHAAPPGGTAVPIGMPIEGTDVLLLDADGTINPVRGEISLRGAHLALGYWNAPELTARTFSLAEPDSNIWLYRTGDVGRRTPDGSIEFLGRADEQIKIRGVRIEPGETEAVLREQPNVAQCVVVADTSLGGEPMLVGFVVLDPPRSASAAELTERIAKSLPDYMVPTALKIVDALPLTRTGKVDRRALPSARDLGVSPTRDFIGPRDAIEQLIADVWSEVLHVSEIGVHDNFFALGGHSLNATQVLARLREMIAAELPLRSLFSAPTIEGFANYVRSVTEHDRGSEPVLRPRERGSSTPLSFSQERMWFLQELLPEGTAYNMVVGVEIDGAFDREVFVASLGDVAARQESLRTTFASPDGEPVQHVAHSAELRVYDRDFRKLPAAERNDAAMALATELVTRPFDLENGPLWWTLIMRLDDTRVIVVFGFHHIIGDLWSFGVLGQELSEAYNARMHKTLSNRAPIEIHYGDFALWQREWFEGHRLDEQMSYWTKQLAGISPLELPADRPRPAFFTGRGDRARIEISPALIERIRAISVREHVTPFMTLFAAFNVLLHRYTAQDDIVVGVPIANRTRIGTEQLIGTFVNTLVHRNSLAGNPSFAELLHRVRAVALEAFAHQDLPFERLVRELAPPRDASRSPVFQVMFNMANAPVRAAASEDANTKPFLVDRQAAQFDLTLGVSITDAPGFTANFNRDLFDKSTIERFLENYATLLEAATREPSRGIDDLPAMPTNARRALIEDHNATTAAYPKQPVTVLVAEQAANAPNATAVECGDVALSYAQLEERSNKLARYLQRRGVTPGALIGVSLNRSTDMLVSLLGVLKSGAGYVPIDPMYPPHRVQFMLDDSGATAVLTESSLATRLPKSNASVIVIDDEAGEVAAESGDTLAFVPQPNDRAYVIFTSGSTGEPKGVQISHDALVNFLWSMRKTPGFAASDSLLAVTTISFDIAGLELYLPLVSGGTVIIADRQVSSDGRRLRDMLLRRKPTVMQATPATWRSLIDAGWNAGDTPDLKILCGGEALPRDLAEEMLVRGREVWNLYGPTETTIWSTVHRVTSDSGAVPIGEPIANTRVYVLDAARELVPVGVPGELYIGGAGVAIGYLNRPELTASRFVEDPFVAGGERMYRTGDSVRYRADGTLEHLGRLDNQVKLRGYRIELGEIETALAKSPALSRCVVEVRQERLVAYVVFADAQEMTASEVRAFLRDTLPDFMVPSLVVPLAELPLTPNGKVDRRALPDPLRAAGRVQRVHIEPSTPTELTIAAIWKEALNVETVSATDNFFELGGHSLLSMRVVHEIQQQTGWRPDPRLLFFDTLANIAASRPETLAADATG
jgi:amino acid adenylation domain-containing protein